jgi:hypothetical protein
MNSKEIFNSIVSDRGFIFTLIVMWLLVILVLIIGAVNIRPSELQVPNHYTSYGVTHFYRDKWYYLINFVVFGGVIGVIHTIISIKLLVVKNREVALGFLWLSSVVLVVTISYILGLMNVVRLAQ